MRLPTSCPKKRSPNTVYRKFTQKGEEQVFDSHVHPSDRARLVRASAAPREGSIEEAEALAAIDEARCDLDDEISGRRDRKRRRAARLYWQDRGAHVS